QLRNDALDVERWNRLHPDAEPRTAYVRQCLDPAEGPIVAATDYMKAVPDMISRWIDRPFTALGTDGFGRSDTREALRTHFEVNAEHIAYAALHGLCLSGRSTLDELKSAIAALGIDPERVNPLYA
nr:pyruvate dehydrogenase (acetyl-transferring), homodimeric type [Chloroflexota bacterium]